MEIRYGTILNVYGSLGRHAGFTIMPADVELDGDSFRLDYRLQDHLGADGPLIIRHAVSQQCDAAWVRARIPKVFGFTPGPAEIEKALTNVGFVVVPVENQTGYPFMCTDHYGRSALEFSDKSPEETIKRAIADAFWGLLIREPEDLADFEQKVYHPGASVWLNYGCASGRVYCEESQDDLASPFER
jgi:hypothetical protein